jgi:alpha-tubulin suppressor-like RCC1 family protein
MITVFRRTSPFQIGTDRNWVSVTIGESTVFGIKTDGTLWGYGGNLYGELGIGTNEENKLSLVQIGTERNWASVSNGSNHILAIKTNGTLWAWGRTDLGQLGDGTTTRRNSPVQIGTDSNWKSVSAGNQYTVAVKTDGTVWTWGENHYGSLGDNSDTNRNRPWRILPPTPEQAAAPVTQQPAVQQPRTTAPATNHTVHIAGRYQGRSLYDTRAFSWKNGTETTLSNVGSMAVAITVAGGVQGTLDVYVAGYIHDNDMNKACYWKNGVLTILSNVYSRAHAISSGANIGEVCPLPVFPVTGVPDHTNHVMARNVYVIACHGYGPGCVTV